MISGDDVDIAKQVCAERDAALAQVAALREAANDYLRLTTGQHTAGGGHMVAVMDAAKRLNAVLDTAAAAQEYEQRIRREASDAALAQVAALREALDHLLKEWLAWNPGLTGLARTRAERILADTAAAAQEYEQRIRARAWEAGALQRHDEHVRREAAEAMRERCAIIADEHRENAKRLQRENTAASVMMGARLPKDRDEFDVCQSAAANASNIAAAIRALEVDNG